MTDHPLNKFDTLWREITSDGSTTVQDYKELEYVFNLIQSCQSYLEIGTAEGKSLYVLAHALAPDAEIAYIDLAEGHTEERRQHYLGKLKNNILGIHGDSNEGGTCEKLGVRQFDVLMIDAGHEAFNVAVDAMFYGARANKFILFHDVQLPEVSRVFDWYAENFWPSQRAYKVINSENFGYGIIEI